jgi:ABC-2 type transport system ATP-binding protein
MKGLPLSDAPAVEAIGLCHDYADRRALDGLDLVVHRGEIFGFLGPNGGGKTTLFRILCTRLKPTGGSVRVLGLDPVRDEVAVRERIGVVFQRPSLDPSLTVSENLRHHGHLFGLSGRRLKTRMADILALVDLTDREGDLVSVLSGGLQRRVELAKGLLPGPSLLIFDEPSTGLDPGARRTFWRDLERLRTKEGVTLLLTTHFIEEAERCDRVAILDEGRLITVGSPSELKKAVAQDVVTIQAPDIAALSSEIEKRLSLTPTVLDDALRIECGDGQAVVQRLYGELGDRIDAITLGKPTLEDVFVHHTGHGFQVEEAQS